MKMEQRENKSHNVSRKPRTVEPVSKNRLKTEMSNMGIDMDKDDGVSTSVISYHLNRCHSIAYGLVKARTIDRLSRAYTQWI